MNTATHPISPEEIMAYVDGELSAAETQEVRSHVGECTECAALADQFRGLSQSLSAWTVEDSRCEWEQVVKEPNSTSGWGTEVRQARPDVRSNSWTQVRWAFGGVALLFVVLSVVASFLSRPQHMMKSINPDSGQAVRKLDESALPLPRQPSPQPTEALQSAARRPATQAEIRVPAYSMAAPLPQMISKGVIGGTNQSAAAALKVAPENSAAPAPMIARSVSLSIVVKDFGAARSTVDAILQRHQGYSAQLNLNTPDNFGRSFQASLRIPAPELNAAVGELRALGRVGNETQSGEEVTQQHADLAARLKTARDTEERFRAILQQRTGKIDEVLEVEREIARVRGEIEGMEAEQKALEHRVDFASVDLQLAEEYQVKLDSHEESVSTRIHNAIVRGYRNAADLLLGIVLFLVEFGPVLMVVAGLFGIPAWLVWRRYRARKAELSK